MDSFAKYGTIALLVVLAICHSLALTAIWSYIAIYNELGHYILVEFSPTIWFYPLLFSHDFIVNFVLILPGAVIVAMFFDPGKKYIAPLYGAVLYAWPQHIEAVNFGFPITWHPMVLFIALVFIFVPWGQIRFLQRRTHAAT